MRLKIDWQRPVTLRSGARDGLIYTLDLDALPKAPGVYIFARRWGKSYEALYVGQSLRLRGRVKSHLNNLRLMRHLQEAKSGRRVVIVGQIRTRPGQQISKSLKTLERGFIRHFLSEGHDLVNKQGVRIRRHEIESEGPVPRSFIPSRMYLERSKGT